jgi:hypothetical protein
VCPVALRRDGGFLLVRGHAVVTDSGGAHVRPPSCSDSSRIIRA